MLAAMHDETRLDELEYQREQVRRHLEWLDREIAAELRKNPSQASAPPPSAAPAPISVGFAPAPAASSVPAPSNPLPGEQSRAVSDVRQDVKKGCLLYFAAALAAVAVTVAVLYFAFGVGRR